MASIPRSQYYYQSTKDDSEIVALLQDLSGQHPTCGFRKLFAYLRRRGKEWNHKRVYRVYKLLKMNKKRRGKRRLPARVRQPLQQAATVNQSWSMDFMSDSLMGVRKFRTFNVMDDCTREALAIEIDTSLSFKRIIRALEGLIVQRGKPQVIRTDNGPEFTSKEFEWWCKEQEIEIQFIQPGRPMQRVY
jgi:putative transposase